MKCPNCNCEMGTNVGICQYCGFDVGKYYERTLRVHNRMEEQRYEMAYWQEKQNNESYRSVIIITMLSGILILQMLTLILLMMK